MNKLIADKIEKLFALAAGTTFPEEASSAIAKAQALMDEHKITQAMLEDPVNEEKIQTFQDPINEEHNKQLERWKWSLVDTLAKANGVFMYARGPAFVATGKPSNVDSLRYMYSYCYREIDRLARQHCVGRGRTYANNFRYGCVDAIRAAIREEHNKKEQEMKERAAASNDCRAVVSLDNALARIRDENRKAESFCRSNVRLCQRSGSWGKSDYGARSAGAAAGAGIYGGSSGRIGAGQKKIG